MSLRSIKKTLESLKLNKISIRELNQEYIRKIKEKSNLNIFIHFNEEEIFNQIENW